MRGKKAVCALVAGCMIAAGIPSTSAQEGYTPRFEPGDCRFQVPSGYAVECGDLVVPEDRSQPDGAWIRLHVAIFKSRNPNPAPDPVIYLAGGGGYNQLDAVEHYLRSGDAILDTRDYIHYNQRGADYNDPVVDCPGHSALLWDMAGESISLDERNTREMDLLLSCRDDLQAQGIDLTQYNSAANAADAHDLRVALGYEEANYYGTSYGTRLALTLMRDYPDGIRSVILDSVYPPAVDYYSGMTPNIVRSLDRVFDACAADAACSKKYPDLAATYYALIDRLNANPVERDLRGQTVMVNGNLLLEALELMLYARESIGALPYLITQADHGNFAPIDSLFEAILSSVPAEINWTMFYAMQCREEIPFESLDTARALAADAPPQIADFYFTRWTQFAFDLCAAWDMPPADPVENEPVISDIPTLVLAGGFDPATPPAWSQLAAATLSHSFYVEFPTLGHGIMRADACGLRIGLEFLDNPAVQPDTACVAEVAAPAFQ